MPNIKKILIAGTDDQCVENVTRHCQTLGLFVSWAHDAVSALQQIDDAFPDLVILDVNMPGGNGPTVYDVFGRDPDFNSIPFIFLTHREDSDTVQICNEPLCFFVPKGPDIWIHLRSLISELLRIEQPYDDHQLEVDCARTQIPQERIDGKLALAADNYVHCESIS